MATYKEEEEEDSARAILLGWHLDGYNTPREWVRRADETDATPGPMQWGLTLDGKSYLCAPSAKIVVWYETEWKPSGKVT